MDWLSPVLVAAVLAAIGWLIVNKLDRIDKKLDRMEERQGAVEKDCMTWADWRELGLDERLRENEREISVLKTMCSNNHGAKP